MTWTDADFYTGIGSVSHPFIIKDKPNGYTAVEQFMNGIGDSNYVGKGYYYKLGQDLDFDGITVKCVGSSSAPFVGTIDGNGYTIKNVHATVSLSGIAVLVYGGNNSILKNCVFEGTVINITGNSGWSYFVRFYHTSSCRFENVQFVGTKISTIAIVLVHTRGTITNCIFNQDQGENCESIRLTMSANHDKIYQTKLLIMGKYYINVLINTYQSDSQPYNNISDCMQLSSEVTVIKGTHAIGRFCNIDKTKYSWRDIHNCYAREDMTVGGSVPTQFCEKDHINGQNVSADVYSQKGFWDGTGVDGTVYLDWDFENVWDWDEVNLRPVLRMSHAPIPSLVTGVWVKTENGWKESTDLTYMR